MCEKIILLVLSVAFIVLCITCIMESLKRASRKRKAAYLPSYMVWIGAICNLVFLVIGWMAALSGEGTGLILLFGLFAFLGMSLMLAWKNHQVSYDKKGFTHRNFLGFQRSFSYEEVTGWEMNSGNPTESHLYVGKKKIPFNILDESSAELLVNVFDAYRKSHGGSPLPDRRELQKGKVGFRAHVHNPEEYLGIFIMLLVFFVGIMVWLAIDGLQPIGETDGQKHIMTFDSWSVKEDAFLLHSNQENVPFQINSYESYLSNAESLKENCDGETSFTLWAKYMDPDDKEPYYKILAISSGEEVYLTFEDATAQQQANTYLVLMIMGVILLLLLLFALLMYLVGRDPQKFPKWVVYACFKKSAIDID